MVGINILFLDANFLHFRIRVEFNVTRSKSIQHYESHLERERAVAGTTMHYCTIFYLCVLDVALFCIR